MGLTLLSPHWLEEMWVLQGIEARGSGQGSKDAAVALTNVLKTVFKKQQILMGLPWLSSG